ncbi:HIT family protein [Streptomyces justiciae]|uniref:HIT domain-containing protein n=1 Tax=Streptomyces justiciae TaxID=2780140 RepID=A0ABU3M751_9ACTN|nr:HIT domain-containing protein [Streptomyces justiciae]MDT7847340.1 HIT domain-containing protein [Streptomyces justiciae]
MDVEAYAARTRSGPCLVCAFLAGHPDYPHEKVYEDEDHVAFLDRWPTVRGKVLVAPKAHIEHVVRDPVEAAHLRLMQVVREVALAGSGHPAHPPSPLGQEPPPHPDFAPSSPRPQQQGSPSQPLLRRSSDSSDIQVKQVPGRHVVAGTLPA